MGCFGGKSKKQARPATQPKCPPKQKAWTEREWKIHGKYLEQLAVPKKDLQNEKTFQQPTLPKVPLSQLKPRMNTLARPKPTFGSHQTSHVCPLGPQSCHCHVADPLRTISPLAKSYVPTQRINLLSQPKLNYQEVIRCFPMKKVMCINKRVIQPLSLYRTKKLATPKYQYLCTPEHDPYQVKPEALTAVATRRTMLLAMPKTYSFIEN
ncbi:uncharacterized protein LOC129776504 [Toxorhynchites rutilus septentrionalis]|uniref:uncharacterized protein LOC129776504 n=1 Tax=Toxorhynchites rutilus septentrionalis TaxID=329112 RepID=UPI00247A8322|nr:uncharacterized protein LOC129776504 [Toxorhynchites rutilus septentrionalis]